MFLLPTEAKESLDILCTSNALPDNLVPKLRSNLENLADEASVLAKRLLKCLAIDLVIDPEEFLLNHSGMLTGQGNNGSCIRLLHYPPATTADEKIYDSFQGYLY